MLIALLVVLGVDLGVIVAVFAVVLVRRLWVSRQPGAFRGAIRVAEGEVPGLGGRWRRGYGRWVRDVLVWTKGPFLFRNELVAANASAGDPRAASPGEVRLLGKHPEIVGLEADGGARITIGVASNGDKALGPFAAADGKASVAE
jgi:Protein of unknown function (DUF2550)